MASQIISDPTLREQAITDLNDADSNLDQQTKRLRALASSVLALLPAEPSSHPLLAMVPGGPANDPLFDSKIALRDALIASRELADMIDDIACMMGDRVAYGMAQAREKLGLPAAPAWATVDEASHS